MEVSSTSLPSTPHNGTPRRRHSPSPPVTPHSGSRRRRSRGTPSGCPHFKICLSGKSGVGKTSIFLRLQGQSFYPDQKPNIGVDSWSYYKDLPRRDDDAEDNPMYEFIVHDTAGMETHNSLSLGPHYRNANCILLVYDVGDISTLHYLEHEYKDLQKRDYCPYAKFILVRNKTDIKKSKRNVKPEDEKRILSTNKELFNSIDLYVDTSAKTNSGISELFHDTLPSILASSRPVVRSPSAVDFSSRYNERTSDKQKRGCCS